MTSLSTKSVHSETGFNTHAAGVLYVTVFALAFVLVMAILRPASAEAEFVFDSKWGENGDEVGNFKYPADIAVDSNGSMYVADTWNDRIQKFSSDGTYLLSWDGGETGSGTFNKPGGVTVDQSGNVYVADTYNNRIQKFTEDGNILLDEWGSICDVRDNEEEPDACDGKFFRPQDVTISLDGNIYVADTQNYRIQKFDEDGEFLSKWGSRCDFVPGEGGNDCNNGFYAPRGVVTDLANDVYVADTTNHRIQKFNSSGTYLKTWGSGSFGSGDGELDAPRGVSVDSNGNVYVADTQNDRVQVFDQSGDLIEKWGRYCNVGDEEDTGACDGLFISLEGIDIDAEGRNVYVADTVNERIQKFSKPLEEQVPTPQPQLPSPQMPAPLSPPRPVASPVPEETYDSACNLKISTPRLRISKSGSARLSVKAARRLFTKGLKGYIDWGKVGGKNVVCKKVKMVILEKRGKRYYLPGTKTRVSKKYLNSKGFPTKGARFFKRKKVGKLTQKRVSKKRQTKISFKQFSRKTKMGRRAMKKLRKLKRGTYHLIYSTEVNGKTLKKTVVLKIKQTTR